MQDSTTPTPLVVHSYSMTSKCGQAKTAEADVEVGDVVHMVVTAYDSRSEITKLPNDIVETGIKKHLGRKPVRYRHVDPNSNEAALLGEVLDKDFTFPRIRDPENGIEHMEAHVPVELYARTPGHVEFINFIIGLHRGNIAEMDYIPQGFGFSLGWIENSAEFIPHELSATPRPKCTTCLSHPGSERILTPGTIPGLIAEQVCVSCQQKAQKGEQMPDDKNKLDPRDQMILDLRSEVKDAGAEITSYTSQIAELESEFDKKYQSQIAEADKLLAEKNSELEAANVKVAELEGKLLLGKTLPERAKIAEMLGLEGEEATSKINTLASWGDEQLKEHFTDLSKLHDSKDKDPKDPILAGSDNFFNEFQINTAEAASVNDADLDKSMKEFLGPRFEEIFPGGDKE